MTGDRSPQRNGGLRRDLWGGVVTFMVEVGVVVGGVLVALIVAALVLLMV
jgi:hypothetical protein